ncbi:MAG TPA: M3 family metallopeptidase [Caldimonas sp.]|nr:M3 family metallopeptidase [Caldimonas sp.]
MATARRAGAASPATAGANPLLGEWQTPYGLPPFDRIEAAHFAPAFEEAMRVHRAEIEAIAASSAPPSFENTVPALDRAGRLLERTHAVFHNLAASETSPELQSAQLGLAPKLAAHTHAVQTHAGLFARIEALYEARERLDLAPDQRRVLERYRSDFVRAGARLDGAARARHARIVGRLAELTTRFGQNVLADEAAFRLELRHEPDLAGLPEFLRAAARQAGAERGLDVPVVTLARSLVVPFLTFSERRDLRERAWRAWTTRGEHDGANDNRPIAREILALRRELAGLHGARSYADHVLADTMAREPSHVQTLLEQVWKPACARAAQELEALEALALSRDEPPRIEPWDWLYYAEKVRKVRYDFEEAQVKPYFPLERMVAAAFDCAGRLFGLAFVEQPEVPAYHPDVKVYEVRRRDGGALVGVFLHDNFARPSKRSGAWMSSYRVTSHHGPDGERVVPIVVNNNNFAKAAPGEPTLLSFDDARTLFHEFGHALHGLLSDVRYVRVAGTRVLRDFVELPSQLFEHWLTEPEVLKRHARHYVTHEPIPDALVERVHAARHFNQGHETVRYAASAFVDLAAHSLQTVPPDLDLAAFERAELDRLGHPAVVGLNHRLPHFQHLFSSAAYAAGYYAYLWAEVLEADAYEAFVEAGDPFDAEVAERLRRCIYASGDSVDPVEAYRAFRGRHARIGPMLQQRGLIDIDD